MTTKRVLLIRHGQTDYNVEGRWQGHMQTDLNATGHEEAKAVAAYLKTVPFDVIYASDLARALQTAEHIATPHSMTPVTDARLREIKLGVFEGLTSDEIREKLPDEHAKWRSSDADYAPPGGESRNAVGARAAAALNDFAAHDGETLAFVAHGGTIRLLLHHLFPDEPAYEGKFSVPNTSITILETDSPGSWNVVQAPATPHLEGKASTTDHP